MSKVAAVIALLLAVLASAEALRGKTALRQRRAAARQDPDASDENEYGDQAAAVNQGASVDSDDDSGDADLAKPQADSGDAGVAATQALATDGQTDSEDDSDSLQGGKKALKQVLAAATNGAVASSGADSAEADDADTAEADDADAAVSEGQDDSAARELPHAEGGDDEQLTASSGGSGNVSADSEIMERLQEAQQYDDELVAPKGTLMSAADSHSAKYGGELASQDQVAETSEQDQEGDTEADGAQAASATGGDDSDDAAAAQLKEDAGADAEDTSDDQSSSA